MKKILVALIITITVTASALGATSNDIQEGVYLRQDVFEAKMDAFMAEIRAMNQQLRSEMKQEIQTVKEELHEGLQATNTSINITDARIKGLKAIVYFGIPFLGVLIILATVAPSLVLVAKELKQQSFSLEDVERLIDAKLQGKNAQ